MSKKESDKKISRLEFEGQRPGEKLLFVFRRHMIAMRKGFYLLLGVFSISAIPALVWNNNLEMFLIPLVGLFVGILFFIYHFIMWYFTVYIVTDQRIRQITQRGFFGKDVIELRLSKIQNISYNIPGLSGEIFKFGTIIVQTIVGDLVINNVDHPEEIYDKLQDAVNNATERWAGDEEDI